MLLAVGIAAFNQLSGINAVTYYAPSIFEMAGASGDTALLQAVAMGVVNLIATMAALSVIDRFGRRKLMIIGSVGYLISLGVVASIFLTSGPDAGFTSLRLYWCYSDYWCSSPLMRSAQGSVIWVFIAEIFPNKVRAQDRRSVVSSTGRLQR
ncbi:sugar and carbohydrate transporter [Pseudonocardia sp. Ae717_Ps2]|nr:sugar and carbohydrate transporter [Pseudonocardia sp. Ae717_Ps2]